jgi:hypothetical protein
MTTSSAPTMFGHLAFRFSASPENLATEALHFILDASAAARRGLRAAFAELETELPELRFATQSAGEDSERPDLVGIDTTGRERFILEAKFWAELTENQPEKYLSRLDGQGVLAFVAPEVRGSLLWREILLRAPGAVELPRAADAAPGFCLARVGGVALAFVSWRRLLASIRSELEAAREHDRLNDLTQLLGLCERMDTQAFLPLTRQEVSSPLYRRVIQLADLIDTVVEELAAAGRLSLKGTRVTPGKGYYIRYFKTTSGWSGSIRLDLDRWTNAGGEPIWFDPHHGPNRAMFPVRRATAWTLARPLQAAGRRVVAGWAEFPAVALQLPLGAERPTVVQTLREDLMLMVDRFMPLAGESGLTDGSKEEIEESEPSPD